MSNKLLIAAGVVFAAAVAVPAFAQTSANTNTMVRVRINFCSELSAYTSRITTALTNINKRVADFTAMADSKKSNRWQAGDQRLAGIRSQADQKRAADYAALEARASTSAQKTAVATFESTVNAAIQVRRNAIDFAIQNYHAGIDAAIGSESLSLSAAAAAFSASVQTALSDAQNSCAAPKAGALTVRPTLVAAIKNARTTFQSARKGGSLETTRQQLATTRDQAVQSAITSFKASLKTAADSLKAAFSVNASTSTTASSTAS